MADHAEGAEAAVKGAGKKPPTRSTRKTKSAPAPPQPPKRKSRTRESQDLRNNKVPKVEATASRHNLRGNLKRKAEEEEVAPTPPPPPPAPTPPPFFSVAPVTVEDSDDSSSQSSSSEEDNDVEGTTEEEEQTTEEEEFEFSLPILSIPIPIPSLSYNPPAPVVPPQPPTLSSSRKESKAPEPEEEGLASRLRKLPSRAAAASARASAAAAPKSARGRKKAQVQAQPQATASNAEEGYRSKLRSRSTSAKEEGTGRKKFSRGRGGRAPAAATGSCTSTRGGRSGGVVSLDGPSASSISGDKSGEGMNNSSTNQSSSTSSSSTNTEGVPPVPPASGSGQASGVGSALSRGLALLSGTSASAAAAAAAAADTDSDDGDMGRLQALLESRGLPPHLFGTLAPRMQQLLHRGISASSGNVTKAQTLLSGLQASGDEGQQLQAAIEMCQLLVMGNEDTLAGFPIKQTVPALITLLSMDHNFDIMNHACRALTYMMEALPRSTPVVAEAVPVFLQKLQVIQCMDVAEQSLTALEMLSRRHAKTILQAGGVSACLTFLDFFSIVAQRAALSVTANCMQNIHAEEFAMVLDSLDFMATRLTQQDKKSVESVCLAFSRLVDSFHTDPRRLEEIASQDLLANLQQLLVVTPPIVSTPTFILILRMLAQLCSRSPTIAVKLLEQNIVGTLQSLLLGPTNTAEASEEVELVQRNPQELLEIVNLIAELLPKLPSDGIFAVNSMMTGNPAINTQDAVQWQWKDNRGQWNSYSPFDSRVIEGAHQSGEDEISLSMQGRTYTVDFLGMQQINEDSGTARTVQRRVNPFFVHNSASRSAAAAAEEAAKMASDERSGYLAAHADFALPFLRPLFALLSEANSSSAGPAVRSSCVKTLLRIVHFLPASSLTAALKPQLVANNLASMLGASDLKIVVGAFQLCSLFMEKLQEEFSIHFRREGVFHQISRISSSDFNVGPSPVKSDISLKSDHPLYSILGPGAAAAAASYITSPGASSNNLGASSSSSSSSTTSMNVLNVPMPTLQPASPYSLCLGGFFQPTTAAATSSTSAPVSEAESGPPPLPPPPAEGTFNLSSLFSRMEPIGPRGENVGRGEVVATSGSSSSTLTTVVHSGSSSSSSNSNSSGGVSSRLRKAAADKEKDKEGGDKKSEDDKGGYDAFKRKRVSKRPVPTTTSSRRHRNDDVTSAAGGMSGRTKGASGSGSGGSKGGFFASLHPSRWTRGGGSSSSSNTSAPPTAPTVPSSNNNSSTVGSATASGNSAIISIPQFPRPPIQGPQHAPINIPSFLPTLSHSSSHKEQVKGWLKEQSLAFTSKYATSPTGSMGGQGEGEGGIGSGAGDGVGVLPKLSQIINQLPQESGMIEALIDLRSVVEESDISSFEINHSGLIPALLKFLTEDKSNGTHKMPRDDRLRAFIHVFARAPLEELSGDDLNLEFIGGNSSALSTLLAKLNSCLSQLEQFQVKVHEVPGGRAPPTSALRFFNTHQLRCNLQRHPECNTLRAWKGGPVKIDSLALVQTIERYLIAKGFGRVRESPRDSGDSDDDNSDDDFDDTLAAAVISQGSGRHKLQFLIGDHVLPYNMTVYQAIRQFAAGGASGSGLGAQFPGADAVERELEFDSTSALFGSSGIWAQTHTIHYRPVPDESAVLAAAVAKKTKSIIHKGPGKATPPIRIGPKRDPLWMDGVVPDPVAPYLPYLNEKLPDGISVVDPCLPVLSLLRVLHGLCRYWRYLYWPILGSQPLIPLQEFVNSKLAAKAQRQLQDPVVIMAGNVPLWLQQIGLHCPFLFPFETRQLLFYSITFDRDRALQRLLDSVPELNGAEREDRVTPRLDRRKRTISRENILSHAEQLMSDFGSSKPLLEIQYENEVGTGLGPTLEFYALVSQEMQKRELDLWHCESSSAPMEEEPMKEKNYVTSSVGLFPKPMGRAAKSTNVTKVKAKFKFLGKFMAKAVMDSRMIDLPLSKALYKWLLAGEGSMCLADVVEVDGAVAASIRKLVSVAIEKKRLERQMMGASTEEINALLEELTLDGCPIDNLGLDFTLPGHPAIDLKRGGKDVPVTIHNLEEYINLVTHWMLFGGIVRQMESWKEGFDSVFPSTTLKMFYPEELEMVFCGANQSVEESWEVRTLMECCRADHGYSLESDAIQSLFAIISSYDAQQRRKFVQFVTGSPRLPVGGFKSLQPPLTIVRKTVEGGDVDGYLPSVMTCVNYLKLPDYSSPAVMADRLGLAVQEGQLSFHLS